MSFWTFTFSTMPKPFFQFHFFLWTISSWSVSFPRIISFLWRTIPTPVLFISLRRNVPWSIIFSRMSVSRLWIYRIRIWRNVPWLIFSDWERITLSLRGLDFLTTYSSFARSMFRIVISYGRRMVVFSRGWVIVSSGNWMFISSGRCWVSAGISFGRIVWGVSSFRAVFISTTSNIRTCVVRWRPLSTTRPFLILLSKFPVARLWSWLAPPSIGGLQY